MGRQIDRIIDLLSDGDWHDMGELNEICFRYSARLADLRAKGYDFDKRHEGSHYFYRMKQLPTLIAPEPEAITEPDGQILMPGVVE